MGLLGGNVSMNFEPEFTPPTPGLLGVHDSVEQQVDCFFIDCIN